MGRDGDARALLLAWGLVGALVGIILMAEGRLLASPAVQRVQADLGGLGLGAAAVPAWSFHAFDPRLEAHCEADSWPIPGGACYAPDHVGPVSEFPEGLRTGEHPGRRSPWGSLP